MKFYKSKILTDNMIVLGANADSEFWFSPEWGVVVEKTTEHSRDQEGKVTEKHFKKVYLASRIQGTLLFENEKICKTFEEVVWGKK